MTKQSYRVRNWSHYNQSLIKRGDITLWFSEEAIAHWHDTARSGKRGRPLYYSDAAIHCGLTLRALFHLSLRCTQGFVQSLIKRLGLGLSAPSYTLLCKRQRGLRVPLSRINQRSGEGLHLVVDSTGLQVFGEGEWKVRQHGIVKHRLWRKLHVAIDSQSQQIVACEVTGLGTQDCEGLTRLLCDINDPIATIIGDGAYDRFRCYEDALSRQARGIYPPQMNARTSQERVRNQKKASPEAIAQRDAAIEAVRALGQAQWKRQVGYHRRSLAETGIFRLKTLLGHRLKARQWEYQATEARVWCYIANRMAELGLPDTVAV